MKKHILIAFALCVMAVALPQAAQARVAVFANIGCCGGGYYPYRAYPAYPAYPAYYYPYYVAPPPVVYAVPPPVMYEVPQQQIIVTSPQYEAPVAAANQTSPTYIDGQGRTCRQFQSTTEGTQPFGTACLQPDGTWRAVQ